MQKNTSIHQYIIRQILPQPKSPNFVQPVLFGIVSRCCREDHVILTVTMVELILVMINMLSYNTIVLYIGINKVWGFLPKNPTKKSAKYLLSDSMTA